MDIFAIGPKDLKLLYHRSTSFPCNDRATHSKSSSELWGLLCIFAVLPPKVNHWTFVGQHVHHLNFSWFLPPFIEWYIEQCTNWGMPRHPPHLYSHSNIVSLSILWLSCCSLGGSVEDFCFIFFEVWLLQTNLYVDKWQSHTLSHALICPQRCVTHPMSQS